MKFLKILMLCSLIAGSVPFACAMDKNEKDKSSDEKAVVVSQKSDIISTLDVVTDINDIQNIIRAYLNEWILYKSFVLRNWVDSVLITPDDKNIVMCCAGDIIKYDLNTGNLLPLNSHRSLSAVAITPDGKKIVCGYKDETIAIWDFESSECLNMFNAHKKNIDLMALTSDGQKIISYGHGPDGIKIWELNSGKLLKEDNSYFVSSIAVIPDNKNIVTGGMGGIRIFDFELGWSLRNFLLHKGGIDLVAITPNGKKIVAVGHDKTISILDFESGEELQILKGHKNLITSIIITPDGKNIISASDNQINIWDVESGNLLQTINDDMNADDDTYANAKTCITMTRDGKNLVSGSYNIKIFQNLMHQLQKGANQDLSKASSKWQEKKEEKCANAGCPNTPSKRCKRCRIAQYCSAECQKAHWKAHKKTCKEFKSSEI